MEMENSSALSEDTKKQIPAASSFTKEDLTSLDLEAKQGGDAAQGNGGEKMPLEQQMFDEEDEDALDPEGDFVDAEAVPSDGNLPESGSADEKSLDSGGARILVHGEDKEDVDEDDGGSVESFDSALERIAVASASDATSPVGPSSPLSEPVDTVQQSALRQLNQLNSGVSSLDTSLLENTSLEEFKSLVAKIAQAQSLSPNDRVVEDILSALLPLVGGVHKQSSFDGDEVEQDVGGGVGSRSMPSAKPTAKDDDDTDTGDGVKANRMQQENARQVESIGGACVNGQLEAWEANPAQGLQIQGADDEAKATKNSTLTLDTTDSSSLGSEHELPKELSEAPDADFANKDVSDFEAGKDSVGDDKAETRAIKEAYYAEQEPEVIEWDEMVKESQVDGLSNADVPPRSEEIGDSGEDGGRGSVDATSLQQTSETPNANEDLAMSKTPEAPVSGLDLAETQELSEVAVEGEGKEDVEGEPNLDMRPTEVDSLAETAVVDIAQEQAAELIGDDDGEEARKSEAIKEQELGLLEEDKAPVKVETADQSVSEHAEAPEEAKEASEDKAQNTSEVVKAQDESALGADLAEMQEEAHAGMSKMDESSKEKTETEVEASAREEQLPAKVVAEKQEDVEAKKREDEVNAETSEPSITGGSEQVDAKADNSMSSEQEPQNISLSSPAMEGMVPNNVERTEEPGSGRELSETQAQDAKENVTSEKESEMPLKEEESSKGDAIKQEEESDSVEAEADDSDKGEEVTENLSPLAAAVNSKSSTAPSSDTPSLGGAGPSLPVRPAGLGRSIPSLEHAPRAVQRSSGASARQSSVANEDNRLNSDVSEGSEDAREKLQMIRVKFLRLAHRLGQSAHNVVVAQVLYRLGLAEQLRGGRGTGRTGAFSFERASVLAEEQEAAGSDDLDFGCTIMVLGKSGVGKSATINSLFDEVKSGTNAYSPATNKVQEITGMVHGIKLRVIDTPGLLTSFADQRRNERIMSSVKRFIKKSPPDIVLYFDRLDMQSRDYGDLPLLRTITDTFGAAVWFNAIVVLTHASSAPPDGANGVPVSYEMFVAQRSHVVQQTIRQAAGDMRLMNPVSLVENHAACRRNRAGQRVLPNGQVWKPQMLLLCFASKILAEANSLLKLQDNSPAKPFGVRSRVPPLPFLLSSLLQSRALLKLPDEQMGSDDESEEDSEEDVDSEGEEDYDDLPPFRRLTKDELKLLDKEQRRIYFEESEYREKLFIKKQLKDERVRKKEMKRRLAALPKEVSQFIEESLEEENASAAVPVPMPDMVLPPSFDSDNPTHRYRYLDTSNQWLVRAVLETHGWDHDSGYDGLNVEKMFVISKKIPASVSGQITKDKKEANLQMECAACFKNGDGKATQAGLDIQTIGKDLAYTLRSETRFSNFKRNKTTCGLAVTLLGDTVAAGMKIEDRLMVGKRLKLVLNGGALTGRGDVAYGGSLEATLRDKDYPIGQFLSTLGLSIMDWHGDLAIGGNLQLQFKVGRTMMIARGNLNNRGAGQISIRASSSEQLQMALIGLIPLLRTFINNRILSSS